MNEFLIQVLMNKNLSIPKQTNTFFLNKELDKTSNILTAWPTLASGT